MVQRKRQLGLPSSQGVADCDSEQTVQDERRLENLDLAYGRTSLTSRNSHRKSERSQWINEYSAVKWDVKCKYSHAVCIGYKNSRIKGMEKCNFSRQNPAELPNVLGKGKHGKTFLRIRNSFCEVSCELMQKVLLWCSILEMRKGGLNFSRVLEVRDEKGFGLVNAGLGSGWDFWANKRSRYANNRWLRSHKRTLVKKNQSLIKSKIFHHIEELKTLEAFLS